MSSVEILKVLPEQRCVIGWASVTSIGKERKPVIDDEGDIIDIADLQEAVLDMMKSANRTAKLNHIGGQVGEIVGSLVLDATTCSALGLTSEREGWITQIYVADDDVWKACQSGELSSFSIGGSAERSEG